MEAGGTVGQGEARVLVTEEEEKKKTRLQTVIQSNKRICDLR
jgi:hypothetical protein